MVRIQDVVEDRREHRALDNKRHIGAIIDEVRRFQGRDEFADDVCIITMRVR